MTETEQELYDALKLQKECMEMLWKAVPWGKTFDMDFGLLNEACLNLDRTLVKYGRRSLSKDQAGR